MGVPTSGTPPVTNKTASDAAFREQQMARVHASTLISQEVFVKSSFKSQFPHKSVNLSFTITIMTHELAILCGK